MTTISKVAGHPYNLRPSDRDRRNAHLTTSAMPVEQLPALVSVPRPNPWPLWEQGQLGCCCEHGVLKAMLFALTKKYPIDGTTKLARLFSYYNGRAKEGTIGTDAGLSVLDGITVVENPGAPLEQLWPYDISKFTEKPAAEAYADAPHRIVVAKHSLPSTFDGIRQGIAGGFPVIIGMTLHESFENTPASGFVPVPQHGEEVLGGHCMLAWDAETAASVRESGDNAAASNVTLRTGSWLSEALITLEQFITGRFGHGYGAPLGPVTLENWWGESFGDSGYVHIDGAILNGDLFDVWQITDVALVPAT